MADDKSKKAPQSTPKEVELSTPVKKSTGTQFEKRASREMASDGGDLRKPKPTVAKPTPDE